MAESFGHDLSFVSHLLEWRQLSLSLTNLFKSSAHHEQTFFTFLKKVFGSSRYMALLWATLWLFDPKLGFWIKNSIRATNFGRVLSKLLKFWSSSRNVGRQKIDSKLQACSVLVNRFEKTISSWCPSISWRAWFLPEKGELGSLFMALSLPLLPFSANVSFFLSLPSPRLLRESAPTAFRGANVGSASLRRSRRFAIATCDDQVMRWLRRSRRRRG